MEAIVGFIVGFVGGIGLYCVAWLQGRSEGRRDVGSGRRNVLD